LWRQVLSVYIKEPEKPAQACVIWMHGLGADASDMMGLVEQLKIDDVVLRHVFLDAPMRPVSLNGGMVMPAWYDIMGKELVDREDKHGIEKSHAIIRSVIEIQLKEGLQSTQIYLAGFSQGGAMALHSALNTDAQLGGVIALSAYLPLAGQTTPSLAKNTPFFLGSGLFDPLVLPIWSQESRDWLLTKGYEDVSYHQYPMEHSICFKETQDISVWLSEHVQGVLQCPL